MTEQEDLDDALVKNIQQYTQAYVSLLKAGANPNARCGDAKNRPVLHKATFQNRVPTLVKFGADVNAVDNDGQTALFAAIRYENPESVKALLEAGADPLMRDKAGRTASEYFAEQSSIMSQLLAAEKQRNLEQTNASQEYAEYRKAWGDMSELHKAAHQNTAAKVDALVHEGVDIESRECGTDMQFTPLHLASIRGHGALCKQLIELGANVNSQDTLGNTPLSYVVNSSELFTDSEKGELVRYLVGSGADPAIKNKHGMSSWDSSDENLREFIHAGRCDFDGSQLRAAIPSVIASSSDSGESLEGKRVASRL